LKKIVLQVMPNFQEGQMKVRRKVSVSVVNAISKEPSADAWQSTNLLE